ncbi:uncharacterized protein STEHIDRAFT_170950 [Stereum hirsutum FP-91666 SS1]|uniref:uncharacterized protein n=1 Tax=Stereum hirsutum (strain FP-91666) TaxID=721885 RepID=UPI000444985D|nr:uncharacterized protein STEHIDRAFT_170950 [Stereum hirsutum FP-91666 SS1]EIM82742.1 hypothetical protein STEHIDRAFT_170950 [Stereum hirsutum FP-91666 SS1]
MFDHLFPLDPTSPLIASAVLAFVLFLTAMRSFFSPKKQSSGELHVKWGRERLSFPFPSPDTKLGALRASLADHTHLPPASFKLIHSGAVMKDDNAPLSAYQIQPGSHLLLLEHTPLQEPSSTSASSNSSNAQKNERPLPPAPRTEASTIETIRAELAKVQKTLEPDVERFLGDIGVSGGRANGNGNGSIPSGTETYEDVAAPAPGATPTSDPSYPSATSTPSHSTPPSTSHPSNSQQPTKQTLEFEHTRLGELLLQALLKLDAVSFEGGWEDARRERKEAVRVVQGLLDRLDGGWRESREGRGVGV